MQCRPYLRTAAFAAASRVGAGSTENNADCVCWIGRGAHQSPKKGRKNDIDDSGVLLRGSLAALAAGPKRTAAGDIAAET